MKVSSGDSIEQLIRNLTSGSQSAQAIQFQRKEAFGQLLDMAKNGSLTGQNAPLDKEKLTMLLELMKVQMNYAVMHSLSGDDDQSTEGNTLGWISPAPDAAIPGQGESNIRQSSTPQAVKPVQSTTGIDAIIDKASRRFGVDRSLIESVIRAESDFNVKATSPKGAMGLMQLMPDTAEGLGVKNAYDPEENIMGGTRFLKYLLDRYKGDTSLALAAYNWGPGNLERSTGKLPSETRNYVAKIMRDYNNG
jgi:hypothetical protein